MSIKNDVGLTAIIALPTAVWAFTHAASGINSSADRLATSLIIGAATGVASTVGADLGVLVATFAAGFNDNKRTAAALGLIFTFGGAFLAGHYGNEGATHYMIPNTAPAHTAPKPTGQSPVSRTEGGGMRMQLPNGMQLVG